MSRLDNYLSTLRGSLRLDQPKRKYWIGNGSFNTFSEKISETIRWSRLSIVGSLSVMKLTPAVPFFGTIILFNESTFSLFQIAPRVLTDFGFKPPGSAGGGNFSIYNLYFLYFGLCFIGCGSIVFAIFCPKEISKYPDVDDYLKEVDFANSPVVAKSNFNEILDAFYNGNRYDYEEESTKTDAELTTSVDRAFYYLLSEMFARYNEKAADTGNKASDQLDLYGTIGYPRIEFMGHMLWSNPKAIWNFTIPFKEEALSFQKDIQYVRYHLRDLSAVNARTLVTGLYVVGFSLVAVPTIITFTRVLLKLTGVISGAP